jgi:hypothetical protein
MTGHFATELTLSQGNPVLQALNGIKKGKAIPLTGRGGP